MQARFRDWVITEDRAVEKARWAAVARRSGVRPHCVITKDLAELVRMLTEAQQQAGQQARPPRAGVTVWTGALHPDLAAWLAGEHGPLTGTDCLGSISRNDVGLVWVDDIALEYLSRLNPGVEGACRRTDDLAVEIRAGGTWHRLEKARDGGLVR